MKKKFPYLLSFLFFISFINNAAVLLQYHHVSDSTPKSTSISPPQFALHLQYLSDHQFNVVPLSDIIHLIKNQQKIPDKTVAITFDDAYINILTQAKPLLDKYKYPYTIFVNPGIIERQSKSYLSWAQLKSLAGEGVIIANHGYEHNSLARIPVGVTEVEWLKQQQTLLLKAEALIEKHTGQTWRYLAYPYGEYTPAIQAWVKENNFIAFSQQSGAIGLTSDLTSLLRFPASMPYDNIKSLKDKLNALPFNITLDAKNAETLFNYKENTSVTFNITADDFYKSQLNCYISGIGKQPIEWIGDNEFMIEYSQPLPTGRVRSNCTAPSISKPGRYYWYSKPWFILQPNKQWYPL